MCSLSVSILLMAFSSAAAPEGRTEEANDDPQIRHAVQQSTRFLEREGAAWMKKQQCASCHHIPAMVWALNEARNRGYQIDEKLLSEVTSWAVAGQNHTQVFPDLPLDKKRTEVDYLGPLLMALGVDAGRDRTPAVGKERVRLLGHAVSQQQADGSWHANSGGRPPVHATRDVQTSWLLLALSDSEGAPNADRSWKSQRETAIQWITRNPASESLQGLAMRILVYRRLGKSPSDLNPLIDSMLAQQNTDGGWSQTKTMNGDAFATGLCLYALRGQKSDGIDRAIRRAQSFLCKNQQPDGSWPMTSRPAEPRGPGPAGDLRPITYFGTAWATVGLVCSSSKESRNPPFEKPEK